jgi:hypothetical protein
MTQQNALDDLAYIRNVMEQTRRYTAAKGVYFVVWGVAVSVSMLLTWLQIERVIGGSQWAVWTPTVLIAWGLTLYFSWKEQREGVAPYHAHLIGMNWTAVGVAMMCVFFIGVSRGTVHYSAISGLSALLVGIGIFNSGHLSGLRWLAGVGVLWLANGAAMLAWPGQHTLPWMAVLLLIGQIVPGLVLMREERAGRAGGAAA